MSTETSNYQTFNLVDSQVAVRYAEPADLVVGVVGNYRQSKNPIHCELNGIGYLREDPRLVSCFLVLFLETRLYVNTNAGRASGGFSGRSVRHFDF